MEGLAPFSDHEILAAIREAKLGAPEEKPVKHVELEALLAAPQGFGDDVPIDPNFHARRLPDQGWRHSRRSDGIEAVIQVHRLREVLALVGFTRFEAVTPDINGEYETDVERAQIALAPRWFACPVCGRRVAKIYRPSEDSPFACRRCHDLTYRSVQNHDARLDRLIKADVPTLREAVMSRNVKLALLGCKAAYVRWGLIEKY